MKYGYTWLDQTGYLDPILQLEVGIYHELFIFNTEESVNCCELKPSFYLMAVGFETELEINEALQGELYRSLGESDHYRHCSSLTNFGILGDFDSDEEAREAAHANPPCYGLEYRS